MSVNMKLNYGLFKKKDPHAVNTLDKRFFVLNCVQSHFVYVSHWD